MGDDIDFVRALLDTYKASANETIKQMNLEELRDTLGEYDLSEEEREEIKHTINKELKGMGISPAEEAKREKPEKLFERLKEEFPVEEVQTDPEVQTAFFEWLGNYIRDVHGWRTREETDEELFLKEFEEGVDRYKIRKICFETLDMLESDNFHTEKDALENLLITRLDIVLAPKGRCGEGKKAVTEVEPEAKLIEILGAFKTNPDGIAEALEAALPEEKKEFFADLIRKRLEQSAEIEAIDWATNVADWQKGCEEAMGVPMYRTRYLKRRFEDPEHPGKYMVLAICYSPKARPYKSEWFNNVPLEDIEHLETT